MNRFAILYTLGCLLIILFSFVLKPATNSTPYLMAAVLVVAAGSTCLIMRSILE